MQKYESIGKECFGDPKEESSSLIKSEERKKRHTTMPFFFFPFCSLTKETQLNNNKSISLKEDTLMEIEIEI